MIVKMLKLSNSSTFFLYNIQNFVKLAKVLKFFFNGMKRHEKWAEFVAAIFAESAKH